MNSFCTEEEIKKIGFKSFGKNLKISKKASFYGAGSMAIGNNVRIDDFCILSGKIEIGSNIHISAFCALYGRFGIKINDFAGLSSRVTVYSASDDFSGEFMIGPLVPAKFTCLVKGKVIIEKFVQVGASSVIFPGVVLKEGSATGSMSMVNKNIEAWTIAAGIPAKPIKKRSKGLLKKYDLYKKLTVYDY